MKMTISLINAWEWYRNCPPNWKDRAMESLKNTLTGEFTGTVATARGDKYEDKINTLLNTGKPLTGVEEKFSFLRGLKQQQWLDPYNVEIKRGRKKLYFTFRGKMDYIGIIAEGLKVPYAAWSRPNIIADLKTTGGTIKKDKYLDTLQHHVYCLAMRIENFVYCVAQFATESALKPVATAVIPVDVELESSAKLVEQKLQGLVSFLEDYNLWDDYFNVFNGGKP